MMRRINQRESIVDEKIVKMMSRTKTNEEATMARAATAVDDHLGM